MNDTSERLLQLRKALKLSQEAFGAAIGMTRSEIKNIEYGKTVLKSTKVPLVCQAFNVSNEWLMTGEGEMFLPATTDAFEALVHEFHLSDREKNLIKRIVKLDPTIREKVVDFMIQLASDLSQEEAEKKAETASQRDARLLREEAAAVEQDAEKSSASHWPKDA